MDSCWRCVRVTSESDTPPGCTLEVPMDIHSCGYARGSFAGHSNHFRSNHKSSRATIKFRGDLTPKRFY